jgi:antitoxin (DNA-binding transcriptional repressor) of toxin-antitoxin stability system
MKTATVRELCNDIGKLSKCLSAGETIQIMKRGQPFARMVPELQPHSFLGASAGTMKLPPDVDAQVGIEWEAMRSSIRSISASGRHGSGAKAG